MGQLKDILRKIEKYKIDNGVIKNKEKEIKEYLKDKGIDLLNIDNEIRHREQNKEELSKKLDDIESEIEKILDEIESEIEKIE